MNIKLCSYSIFLFLREIPRAGNILLASLCRHDGGTHDARVGNIRGIPKLRAPKITGVLGANYFTKFG